MNQNYQNYWIIKEKYVKSLNYDWNQPNYMNNLRKKHMKKLKYDQNYCKLKHKIAICTKLAL